MKEDLECLEKEILSVEFRIRQYSNLTPEYKELDRWKDRLVKAKIALLIRIMEKYE